MISLALITHSFVFSVSFVLVLLCGIFLPGYLVKRALAPFTPFTAIATTLVSLAIGIGIVNASLLSLGAFHIPLTAWSVGAWYLIFIIALFLALRFRSIPFLERPVALLETKKEITVAALFIVFIFFIKIFYLSGTILPTSTDLGHHLYWAKLTTDTQALPIYQKQEIVQDQNGTYSVSAPTPIADFIIGEHLPLSFIHIFTGASYFGTFPLLFLFLLNISSVVALALLLYAVGKNIIEADSWSTITPATFFLAGLFVFGSLFALASPEMKFVSGGVIGNVNGNFFIPLILLLLIRALSEKSAPLFALAFLLMANLAYTHHLSTFILLFVLIFSFLTLIIFWRKDLLPHLKEWSLLLFKPAPLATLVGIGLFALFIALPTYLETNAVGTAVGAPSKDTRTGLTLLQLTTSNSALKLGLAIFGLFLIASTRALRKNLGAAVLFGYGMVLLIMTMVPQFLYVDIPSTRIAHYLSFPLGLLAIFAILSLIEKSGIKPARQESVWRSPYFLGTGIIIWLAFVAPGLEDNGRTLTIKNQGLFVQETFSAARYLQDQVQPGELIVKDHNFIEASDTWMKLFFSQDYNYPFSRSYFQRYEDNPEREHCTLAVIATPNAPLGKQCFKDLPVRFLVVNPKFDQAQFTKSSQFSLIYSSANVAVFQFNRAVNEPQN
jgi:hypothetical protein